VREKPKPRAQCDVRDDVLSYLADYVSVPTLTKARGDVVLKDCGLDSFGTFEFVLGLEERLGLTISDEFLDARRCRSVNGIVDLLVESYARGRDR